MDIAAIRNSEPPPTQAPTTAEPVTETYIIPHIRLELPTKRSFTTTTENYETTTYQTTTQDSVTDSESLIASQSSWYTGPTTTIPTTTVRNYEETKVSFNHSSLFKPLYDCIGLFACSFFMLPINRADFFNNFTSTF
jgi:hypothetical protein